jgi:hypothetical protein
VELIEKVGFSILRISPTQAKKNGISRGDLSSTFKWLTDDDLVTSQFDILLKKKQ